MGSERNQYSKTREDFERLSLEERAAFLVEGMFSTMATLFEETGHRAADTINEMAEQARKSREGAEDQSAQASQESSTAQPDSSEEEEG